MKMIAPILFLFISCSVTAQPHSINEKIEQGNNFYKHQQYTEAAAAYNEVLATDPGNATARFNLANTLAKQKKQDEAVKSFTSLAGDTKEKDVKSKSYYNKGAVLSKQKKLEESIEAYKNALRQNPDDNEARENLQKALLELKKKNPPKKKENDQQKNKQEQQQKKQQQSKMSPKEAEQRLKLMQQKEKEIQERLQREKAKTGGSQTKDW